ncbi:YraN family protein [Patescibacteria group bacterium]|nr:YraN family protein [Patescibacteria group bacterium]
MGTKELGQFGEDLAFDYLRKNGYKVLERNYIKVWDDKTKGEIDIIAKKATSFVLLRLKLKKKTKGFIRKTRLIIKNKKSW